MKTIEQNWQEYKASVYPDGMSANQEHAVRSAFMAGTAMMLECVDALADLPDDDAVKALKAFSIEMGDIAFRIFTDEGK